MGVPCLLENRKQITSTLLIATVVAGTAMLSAAEEPADDNAKLPQTITVKCSVDSYAFKPIRESWVIDQLTTGLVKFDLPLQRHDPGGAMRRVHRRCVPYCYGAQPWLQYRANGLPNGVLSVSNCTDLLAGSWSNVSGSLTMSGSNVVQWTGSNVVNTTDILRVYVTE